jgi:hypothetical protein
MAVIISVLVIGLGAALVWGPDRSLGGVEVSQIGVIVLAVGVVGVIASLLLSKRAASERGTEQRAAWFPDTPGWQRTLAEVEAEPEPEPFSSRSPQQPPS